MSIFRPRLHVPTFYADLAGSLNWADLDSSLSRDQAFATKFRQRDLALNLNCEGFVREANYCHALFQCYTTPSRKEGMVEVG